MAAEGAIFTAMTAMGLPTTLQVIIGLALVIFLCLIPLYIIYRITIPWDSDDNTLILIIHWILRIIVWSSTGMFVVGVSLVIMYRLYKLINISLPLTEIAVLVALLRKW